MHFYNDHKQFIEQSPKSQPINIHYYIQRFFSYLYVKRKTNQLKPRISGLNLAHKSMAEQFHFEAPKFIDIGFTDLNKYG